MTQRITSVVIMNMHYSGLGIARALADSGLRVIGMSFSRSFFGKYSRFAESRLYPDPQFEPDACLQYLTNLANDLGEMPLLLPTRDIDVLFMMRNRETLDACYTIPYPENTVLDRIVNKDQLYEVATKIDIRCPHEIVVEDLQTLDNALPSMTFPIVAKPVVAADWRHPDVWNQVGRQKVRRFDNSGQLHSFYNNIKALAPRMSLQSYIAGPDSNLRVVGAFKAPGGGFSYFSLRKMLQYPKEAGTGIVLETCQEELLAKKSDRLLSALGYHGIAEIEFKYDSSSDDYVLIEVNPRHWDQHYLGVTVGVNLTRVMVDNYNGGETIVTAVHTRPTKWIADDQYLANLLRTLLHRDYSLRYYLRCFLGKKVFAVFALSDFKPFAALMWFSILEKLRRVIGAFGHAARRTPGQS